MKNNTAKILILDIETAPAKVFTWGLWGVNIGINQIIEDGYILCWAAKWYGQKRIMWDSLLRYRNHFKADPANDKQIATTIWKLVDQADIVVTHNGDEFDLKWLNATFIKHHLPPVSTFKSVDTKKEAKKTSRFISNKLDFLARKLELGYKIDTGGFELWRECMTGNPTSWKKMLIYCKHDVRLLERIYKALRPFIKLHPNLGLWQKDGVRVCPNCGSDKIRKKGFFYTAISKFQRFICLECGKNIRDTHRDSGTGLVGV